MTVPNPIPDGPSITVGADLAPGGYFVWLNDDPVPLKAGEFKSFVTLIWALRMKHGGLAAPQDFDLFPGEQNVAHKRISRLKEQLSAGGEHSRGLIANRRGYCSYRLQASPEHTRVRPDIQALSDLIPNRIIQDLLRTEPPPV